MADGFPPEILEARTEPDFATGRTLFRRVRGAQSFSVYPKDVSPTVLRVRGFRFYWPQLDVDVAVESIEHPEKYPLVSQAPSNQHLQPATARGKSGKPKPSRTRLRR